MHSKSYSTWVCLCVCLSVTQHLTYRMFICSTNDTTYLKGNEGQKIYGIFSVTTAFVSYGAKQELRAEINAGLPQPDSCSFSRWRYQNQYVG